MRERDTRYGEWQERADSRRYKMLYICIIVSVVLHLLFIFSISPWWMEKVPKVKPRKVKAVSLKIKPRPAVPRPPVKAPPRPEPARPVKEVPERKPVYTKKEIEKSLARVRSEEVPMKYARPRTKRVKDVIRKKEEEAREWVVEEFDALKERIEREAAGEVGYSRVIDLKGSSDYQLGRLMDHFKMSLGYGSRKIIDFNLLFTSEWLFTPGQIRNIGRRGGADYRKIVDSLPSGEPVLLISESGEGPPRCYISPTVAVVAAILEAEEKYFTSTGADPDDMERLVFGPVWTYKGPAFKVVKAEKKGAVKKQPVPNKKRKGLGKDKGKRGIN